jgi:hypothetical protein
MSKKMYIAVILGYAVATMFLIGAVVDLAFFVAGVLPTAAAYSIPVGLIIGIVIIAAIKMDVKRARGHSRRTHN